MFQKLKLSTKNINPPSHLNQENFIQKAPNLPVKTQFELRSYF